MKCSDQLAGANFHSPRARCWRRNMPPSWADHRWRRHGVARLPGCQSISYDATKKGVCHEQPSLDCCSRQFLRSGTALLDAPGETGRSRRTRGLRLRAMSVRVCLFSKKQEGLQVGLAAPLTSSRGCPRATMVSRLVYASIHRRSVSHLALRFSFAWSDLLTLGSQSAQVRRLHP